MSIGYRKQATYHRWQGFYDAEFPCNPFNEAEERNPKEAIENLGAGGLANGPGTIDIIWYDTEDKMKGCCFETSETGDCPTCDIQLCKFLQAEIGGDCCVQCTDLQACCGENNQCIKTEDICECNELGGKGMQGHDSECECEPDECGDCGADCGGRVTEPPGAAQRRSGDRFSDPVGACCIPVTKANSQDFFMGSNPDVPFGFHGNPSWECRVLTSHECAARQGIFHRDQKECGGSFSGPCYCGTEPIGSCCYCNGESATNCVEGITERQCKELGCLQPDGETTYSYWSECGHCGEGGFNYPGADSCKTIAAANFGYIDPDNNPSGLKHACCFGEDCDDTISATCQCECQGGTVICTNSASCSCGATTCLGQPDTSFTDGANSDLNRRDGKVFVGKPKDGYGGLSAADSGYKISNSQLDITQLDARSSSLYQDPIMGRDTRMSPQKHPVLYQRHKHHGVSDHLRTFERGERNGPDGDDKCDPDACDLGSGPLGDPHQCQPCGFTMQGLDGELDSPSLCLGSECCKLTNCDCGLETYEPEMEDEPDCCKLINTEQCANTRAIKVAKEAFRNVSPFSKGCDGSWSHFDDTCACTRGYEPRDYEGDCSQSSGSSSEVISCDNGEGAYVIKCTDRDTYNSSPDDLSSSKCCAEHSCADSCRCYGTGNFDEGKFVCNMCDSEHYGCFAALEGFTGSGEGPVCPNSWEDGPGGQGEEGCEGHQEDYDCCTHPGVVSHLLIDKNQCQSSGGKKGEGSQEPQGASVSCIRQHTYNCLWIYNAYSNGGAFEVKSGEYYKMHGVECAQVGAQAIAGEFLFGDYLAGGTGNSGCASSFCEGVCGAAAGDSCVTIRGNVLSQLSQNAKIFMRNVAGDEYSCDLQGYWGVEDGEIDPLTCAGPQRTEVCDTAGHGSEGRDGYKGNHPMHKSCIAESLNHHMQKLIDEADEAVSGPEDVLNLSTAQARAVAAAYYEAFVNLNFLSRYRGVASTAEVQNRYWKTKGTIVDYCSVIELPMYFSYINQDPTRESALLGKLVGLERSGAVTGEEDTGGNSLKPWDYFVVNGTVQEICDTTDTTANQLYPECLYNNLSIPTSPLCNELCPLRAGDLRDFTIGDFIDTHGNCQLDQSTLENPDKCDYDIENMFCYTDRTTMFGPYGNPFSEEDKCIPNALWHDPCAVGLTGPWANIPAIYVAAAAFPELMCLEGKDPLIQIEAIIEKCNAERMFGNKAYEQEVQVAANSAGFSSVKDYLRHIGKTTRFDSSSSPVSREAPRRSV